MGTIPAGIAAFCSLSCHEEPHLEDNPLICTALKLKTNLDVAEVSKLVNLDLAINKDPRVMDEEGDDDAVNR